MRRETKHGPRLDEGLKAETRSLEQDGREESRSDEGREHEDVPLVDETAERERTELARHLRPSAFPGDRDRLLAAAEEDGAPPHVVEQLRRLPAGVELRTMHELWVALRDPGAARGGREGLRAKTMADPLTEPHSAGERRAPRRA